MPTVLENIIEMAELVKETKRRTHLSEQTVLRIIDMNLAIAQRGNANPLQQGEAEEEDEDGPIPFPTPDEIIEPEAEAEEDVVAAATEPQE